MNELLFAFCLWMAWICFLLRWAISDGTLASPESLCYWILLNPDLCHQERLGRRPWLGLPACETRSFSSDTREGSPNACPLSCCAPWLCPMAVSRDSLLCL